MITRFVERALRSALRQTRGALGQTNLALQSPSLSESERRVLEAARTVQLELQASYLGQLHGVARPEPTRPVAAMGGAR